ncbi:MAG: hypothetical protein WC006_03210 [Bacilli bacterium]|nr:hypothetical protein [Bacilli bacterium]
MKLMLILFSIFSIKSLSFEDVDNQEYINELNKAYEEYALVDEYTNNYYDLQLYVGKINSKIYYGIYFKNKIPNKPYILKLSYDEKTYLLRETSRGDVIEVAVDLSDVDQFSFEIYDKNNYKYPIPKFANVKTVKLEEFQALSNRVVGEGSGVSVQQLRADFRFDSRFIIYIALVSVLMVCGGIILFFFKKKKGMFNADIKSANVFNFKEFINASKEDYQDTFNRDFEEVDSFEEAEIVEDTPKDPNESLISQTYVWQHYEEEKSDFNIKAHLNSLNLDTDYLNASLEDKNKVMLELMKLRDQNKITYDDYLDEISELWKK